MKKGISKKPTTNKSLAGKVDGLTKTTVGLAKSVDDLARITARGFEAVGQRFDGLETRMDGLETRMESFEKKLEVLTETVSDIANKLAHYIDLHEERYLDLKHRYKLLTRWAEKVASKTGIPLDIPSDF